MCKFTAFWGTLHWPAGAEDLEHFGCSFVEVLILLEQWAGHRLLSENVTRHHVRANRPISISPVPVSELSIHWQLGSGFGQASWWYWQVFPCRVGSHMSRLRLRMGAVFSWSYFTTSGELSSSMSSSCMWGFGLSSGCGDGAFGWNTQAPSRRPAFYQEFSPLYQGMVLVVRLVKGVLLPLFISWTAEVTFGKRVRLTRKTRPSIPVLSHPDPGHVGHPTPRRWKRLLPPGPPGPGGEVGQPRNLFHRLGLGEVCTAVGNRLRGFRLVSSAEGTGALAPVRFNQMHSCARMTGHACATLCPHPPSPLPSSLLPPPSTHTTTTTHLHHPPLCTQESTVCVNLYSARPQRSTS